jgi:ADP-ribosyl-[dinitrogen reductase] hydrolase
MKQNPKPLAFTTRSAAASSQQQPLPVDKTALQAVVTAALWSFFAGDALASPTHWFYGGFRQVQQYYGGKAGITGYTKPVYELPGSILNKSNLSGGGRSPTSTSTNAKDTIIGNVINHGKQDLWSPDRSIHYHATLQAGENTLEAQLARVLLHSIAANRGTFVADHFRQAYVTFMTTPGSHNDTYASTCHRMFFSNWHYKKLAAEHCPDNDRHNVDTMDGLVLPTVTALAVAGRPDGTVQQASTQAAATVAVTRNSALLEQYAAEWGAVVFAAVRAAATANDTATIQQQPRSDTTTTTTTTNAPVVLAAQRMAQRLGLRTPRVQPQDEITACYLDSAVPAMLDTLVKYHDVGTTSVWDALLANANTGGENVHRGSCLGAVWGASTQPAERRLVQGLYQHEAIQQEIQAFVEAIAGSDTTSDS